jgi:hypothetical protein
MLKMAGQRGVQFGCVRIGGGYGKEPIFLRSVDEQDCRFVADVHCVQTIYLHDPDPQVSICSVPANSPSIVNPNALASALTSGQPHRQLMLGSDSLYVRVKEVYRSPITCTHRFGYEMAKKKSPAAGISWCVGKSARTVSLTIVYRMRR